MQDKELSVGISFGLSIFTSGVVDKFKVVFGSISSLSESTSVILIVGGGPPRVACLCNAGAFDFFGARVL
jgi:hypothetical protein